MAPALLPGDRLLAIERRPVVGTIAVLPHPTKPGTKLVKRVVAGPHWDVRMSGSELELIDPAGRVHTVEIPPEPRARAWSLSDDEVFVLSDNVAATRADSRVLGPLPVDGATTAKLRYRPLARFGVLKRLRGFPPRPSSLGPLPPPGGE